MTNEQAERINRLDRILTEMEKKAEHLNDDIEYIKNKLVLSKIEASK
jgi:hypothetical protein